MKMPYSECAELLLSFGGDERIIPLSNMQFAVIVKILGLQLANEESFACYDDFTLKQFSTMKANPLSANLVPVR